MIEDSTTESENREQTEPTVVDAGARVFGKYRLCYELGSGGMATVYLARATGAVGFEKLVAVKLIHARHVSDPRFVTMFFDEARLAARMNHPNVCSVLDFGEAGGRYYIAMEYLPGESLSRVRKTVAQSAASRNDPRLCSFFARIIADAAEGLHAAHEMRAPDGRPLHVVHRDVSTGNLLLTYDGRVSVLDFGIARAADRLHRSFTGEVKGTLAFMAPERLQQSTADRRADIWSLGVVLWELVTSKELFPRGTPADTIVSLSQKLAVAPSRVRPDLPPSLDPIILKALARNPDERYATAREFAQALTGFVHTQPTPVGLGDLAEWMDSLFPGARDRATRVADATREMDTRELKARPAPTTTPAIVQAAAPPPQSSSPAILAIAFLIGGLGIAGGTWIASRGTPDAASPEPPISQTPTPTPPEQPTEPAPPAEPASDNELPVAVDPTQPEERPEPRPEDRTPRPIQRTAQAEPADEAQGTGEVTIATPERWATVYEGGRLLGQTPVRLQLAAGTHVLDVFSFGREPGQRVNVRVRSGATERIVVPAME